MGDCAQHTAPIRAIRGSLESLHQGLQNDTTMAGNGSGYFEIWPCEVDLAPRKFDPFLAIFGPFWTRFWNRYWEIVLSIVHQSGPLGGRWNPCTKGYKTTPQSPEMVQATSRYDPETLTLLLENLTHSWSFWSILDPILE